MSSANRGSDKVLNIFLPNCDLRSHEVFHSTSWCKLISWSVHFHDFVPTCSLNPVFTGVPKPPAASAPSSSVLELMHTCVFVRVCFIKSKCVTTVRSSFRMIIFLIQGLRRWDWTSKYYCCVFIHPLIPLCVAGVGERRTISSGHPTWVWWVLDRGPWDSSSHTSSHFHRNQRRGEKQRRPEKRRWAATRGLWISTGGD